MYYASVVVRHGMFACVVVPVMATAHGLGRSRCEPALLDYYHQCADVPGTEPVSARVKKVMSLFTSWYVPALGHWNIPGTNIILATMPTHRERALTLESRVSHLAFLTYFVRDKGRVRPANSKQPNPGRT